MRLRLLWVGGWLALLSAISSAGPADAGRWFGGVESGYLRHRFEVTYNYVNGGLPDKYVNRGSGGECALTMGYAVLTHPNLALDLIGRFAVNNAEWVLDTVDEFEGSDRSGRSRLTYKIPFSGDLLIRPRLLLPSKFSVFGEAGVRCGWLDFQKESETSTHYKISKWAPGFIAGGGLQYDVSPELAFQAVYRYAIMDERKTTSAFPDGLPWERVAMESRTQSLSIGFAGRF